MTSPHDPTSAHVPDTPWEEAMSRDFDARVRDLHEAPFDFTAVQGKARRIRRNRRAAVAGGILGVAAVITPIAVLSNGGTPQSKEPQFAPEITETTGTVAPDEPTLPDYLQGRTWHQADGGEVPLEQAYDDAVLWNDNLVATRFDGEAFLVADVVDPDGNVIDSFETTAPVVVNDAGTTIAYVDTDGDVMTRWDSDEVSLGQVDLAAAGEGVAFSAVAITGGPDCFETADGCTVYVNSSLGENPTAFDSHGINDNPVPGALDYRDATTVGGSRVTYVRERNFDNSLCTGLYDLQAGEDVWTTCDYDAQDISPDGSLIAALPEIYDGNGPTSIHILDADSGQETGLFSPEGGFVWGDLAWTADDVLVLSAYDGANWHLYSMEADGATIELAEPVKGPEYDSAFRLVRR